jgi:hypothetical protein
MLWFADSVHGEPIFPVSGFPVEMHDGKDLDSCVLDPADDPKRKSQRATLSYLRFNLAVQLRARSYTNDGIAYGIDIPMTEAGLL